MKKQIKRILVVDDETVFAKTISRHLRMEGYQVEVANDGLEGKEIIAKFLDAQGKSFDLVITDLNMPKVSGIELIKWLHEKHPLISVIVVTGFGLQEIISKSLREGMDLQVAKPLKPKKMLELIDLISKAKELQQLNIGEGL